MNIPSKYEDVVAELDAALGREAALREELATLRESYESMRDRKNSIVELQQRLTVAEQRAEKLTGILRDVSEYVRHPDYDWYPCDRDAVSDALKPAEGAGS